MSEDEASRANAEHRREADRDPNVLELRSDAPTHAGIVPRVHPTPSRPRRRMARRWLLWAALPFLAWWGIGLWAALAATAARPAVIPAMQRLGDAVLEPVATTARDGVHLRGWFAAAPGAPPRCVVLVAGIHGNRLAMLARGQWYLEHGWSALVADLRGTGESDPVRISMGWHEALDLCAWHSFLAARGMTAIAVHGQSLGAAAAVYTAVRGEPPPSWSFAVIESCYTDVSEALHARLPWIPAFLLWPMVASAQWLLDVDVAELAPVAAITHLRVPTLLIGGSLDTKCGPDAIQRLLAASGAHDKKRADVDGVGHVDLWRAGGDSLHRTLASFLAAR